MSASPANISAVRPPTTRLPQFQYTILRCDLASLSIFSSFLPSSALLLLLFLLPLLLFLLLLPTPLSTDDEPAAGSRSSRLLRVHRLLMVEIEDSIVCLQVILGS